MTHLPETAALMIELFCQPPVTQLRGLVDKCDLLETERNTAKKRVSEAERLIFEIALLARSAQPEDPADDELLLDILKKLIPGSKTREDYPFAVRRCEEDNVMGDKWILMRYGKEDVIFRRRDLQQDTLQLFEGIPAGYLLDASK